MNEQTDRNEQTRLSDFLDWWIETVIKGNVRRNTYTAYRGYIDNHIKRLLGNNRLKELTPAAIQQFVHTLCTEERGLAAKTVRVVASMLSGALECAAGYGYIPKNPCVKMRLPKAAEKEVEVFTQDEQSRIEYAVERSEDARTLGIVICLYTGLRLGELCGLRWENIDFENKFITVRKSLNRAENKGGGRNKTVMLEQEPKTANAKRIIPLPDFLREMLKKAKSESNGPPVISMKNGRYVNPRTLQILYAKLLKTAGVPHCKFHTTRHTFATRAIEIGMDIKSVSEILGHANATITINRYVHSLTEQKIKGMRMLNAYFRDKKAADSMS
ncbi:site-specific integrase [Clostridia bacterium]|nr:site-specific integrase [Clostridia bacterium]